MLEIQIGHSVHYTKVQLETDRPKLFPYFKINFQFFPLLFYTAASDETTERPATHSFLTIEYYQQFFNVDTAMVLDRIASSMIPKRAPVNYLKQHIGSNPDLYGPFWIVVTLVWNKPYDIIKTIKIIF